MITITKPDGTKVEIPDRSHAIIHPDGRIEVMPPPVDTPGIEPWPWWMRPPAATPVHPTDEPPCRVTFAPTTSTGSEIRINDTGDTTAELVAESGASR